MTLNDPLANAMSKIEQAERDGKTECLVSPGSSLIKRILGLFADEGYLGKIEEVGDNRNTLRVSLSGNINKSGVVKPRYNVKMTDLEKFEQRYLPSKNMGILVVSTPQGVMTHREAKKKNAGGRVLAYCY